MNKPFISRPGAIAAALTLLLALSSCSTPKSNLSYFRDITVTESEVPAATPKIVKIVPDDELFISVSSADPVATAHFNLPSVNPATQGADLVQSATPRQLTYIVDSKGDINMPQIGTVHVAGLTTEQLRDDLVKRISKWVDNPQVDVRLMNFRINVLGEVNRPGKIDVTKNRYTILQAISDAGDLTPYGVRDHVLLIRDENGVQKRVILDLTSSDLLTSEYFYLQPNDYIYVTPNQVREGNAKFDSDKNYKLSMISTVVSATSVIASLVIALTVK